MHCGACLCCCCTSSRGASFFCTSLHVFFGMYLSIKWILVAYVDGKNVEYFQDDRMRVLYPLILVYILLFLVLGCVNFIAVDRESLRVLKWSIRAFLILQLIVLLTNLLLAFAFPELENDLAVHRVHHINLMIFNVVATAIYFYIIWRYIFSLENGIYIVHKKKKMEAQRPDDMPSAPWSESGSVASRLGQDYDHDHRQDVEDQTLPLRNVPEPQPCSSKNSNLSFERQT